MREGLIQDPYLNFNVDSVQWVEHEDWEYRTTLNLNADLFAKENIDLVFKGLDTFAEVYLNGAFLGKADNMFRTWRWSIKQLAHSQDNELRIVFRSPIKEGSERRGQYGLQLPHDSDPSGVSPYVRKAAYQFGWDFAPRLVTSGVWLPAEIHAYDAHIPHWFVTQKHVDNDLALTIVPVLSTSTCDAKDGRFDLIVDGQHRATIRQNDAAGQPHNLVVMLHDVERWYTHDKGEQPLHQVRVEYSCKDLFVCSREEKMGWRTIELDQSADSIGTSFTFKVNGEPVFMKGCNLVPPDMFLPRAGDGAWLQLVERMVEANMNMVRVWGGGVYPPDAFFEACDTAGILVWQDFMFANMTPFDTANRASIEREVLDQLGRIGWHPSLALLCGNNELEVAWRNWGWQDRYGLHGADSARVWEGHMALFHGPTLRTMAEDYLDIPYVTTSPLSNWGNAEGMRHGSYHYWGVWHADSSFASYANNIGRFVSEYGFQSWPDSSTLALYIDPTQLFPGSAAWEHRQRSYRRDGPTRLAMERELGMVPSGTAAYCRASQLLQAKAYGMAARAHMSAQPHCMGSLVWQLNEPWPAPSWSILEYSGRRKPAFHSIKAAYLGVPH